MRHQFVVRSERGITELLRDMQLSSSKTVKPRMWPPSQSKQSLVKYNTAGVATDPVVWLKPDR